MPARNPTDVAAKWSRNLGASTQQIQQGVEAVQTAPGVLAARQATVWAQNTAAAQQKFARNVQGVTLGEWQQATIQKGIPRIAQGATQAEGKYAAALQRLLPFIDAGVRALPPRGTPQQNLQRMMAMAQHMLTYNRGSGS